MNIKKYNKIIKKLAKKHKTNTPHYDWIDRGMLWRTVLDTGEIKLLDRNYLKKLSIKYWKIRKREERLSNFKQSIGIAMQLIILIGAIFAFLWLLDLTVKAIGIK